MELINAPLVAPYVAVLVVVLVYLAIFTFGVIYYRKNPEIEKRNIFLILTISVSSFLLALLYYIRSWYNKFPCLLSLWIINIAYPAFKLSQVFSFLRLILFYKINELKISRKNVGIIGQKRSGKSQMEINKQQSKSDSALDFNSSEFILKYRRYFTDRNFSIFMGFVVFAMLCFNLIYQGIAGGWDKTPLSEFPNSCPSLSTFRIPLFVFLGIIYYILNPFLIYASWGMHDGYGIRWQMMISACVGGVILILVYVWEFHVYANVIAKAVTGGETWGFLIVLTDFTLFVSIPVIRAARLSNHIQRLKFIRKNRVRANSTTSTSSNTSESVSSSVRRDSHAISVTGSQRGGETATLAENTIFNLIDKLRGTARKEKPKWNPDDSEKSFRKVMSSSFYRNQMLEVSAKSFCPENTMFFYAYLCLWISHTKSVEKLDVGSQKSGPQGEGANKEKELCPWDVDFKMPDIPVPENLLDLYDDLYSAFFVDGGDFELNIPSKLRTPVITAFGSPPVKMNVLDDVNQAVLRMLYENTFKILCNKYKSS